MLGFLVQLPLLFQILLFIGVSLGILRLYLRFTLGVCNNTIKLNGKTVIITGANTGIGKETALELARRGAKVILACRDIKKAATARDEIVHETNNRNVVVRQLDLASLQSVRKFASDILKSEKRLDILINNAGCAGFENKTITEDGLEYQMQANYFGHFLLTNLLLGKLKESSPSRIINVSSMAHAFVSDMNLKNINSEILYDAGKVYYYSKLCQILFSRFLAPRISKEGVTINCLHPGAVQSEIFRYSPFWVKLIIFLSKPFFKTSREGAQTTIHLATSVEVEGVTGKYFSDCKVAKVSKLGQDDTLAKQLWELSEKLVKLKQ